VVDEFVFQPLNQGGKYSERGDQNQHNIQASSFELIDSMIYLMNKKMISQEFIDKKPRGFGQNKKWTPLRMDNDLFTIKFSLLEFLKSGFEKCA
jgi:hypothetical protein